MCVQVEWLSLVAIVLSLASGPAINGISALAPSPGQILANATDNAIETYDAGFDGISADGAGAYIRVSGNTGLSHLDCRNAATMITLGNNSVEGAGGTCISAGTGF